MIAVKPEFNWALSSYYSVLGFTPVDIDKEYQEHNHSPKELVNSLVSINRERVRISNIEQHLEDRQNQLTALLKEYEKRLKAAITEDECFLYKPNEYNLEGAYSVTYNKCYSRIEFRSLSELSNARPTQIT